MALSNFTSWFDQPLSKLYYNEDHDAWRHMYRRFVDKEIAPNLSDWEAAGIFPRELYPKAAQLGVLQMGYPEEYGGVPETDHFFSIISAQEQARAGGGGVNSSLITHTIGMPPIVNQGTEAMKARIIPGIVSGEKISALAITEPSGGSDVANLQTTARREGDHYIVNGSKMFITSGTRADFFTVAVRTGGPGRAGISLLLMPNS